ncbi:uncharacterized protein LOC143154624 [Ptiloglossa arizonensis]|uniref:uncharacterized protein LOC143154624 n=1 Tax=Ptiloglossa arizonensis TaxID=3350558 RepID=UPI003F9FE295
MTDLPQDVTVARVAIRVPPFWEKNPETWFRQLESQFVLARITQDSTKYHYVSAHLENQYADLVNDIISDPPTQNMYDTLKAELIRRLSDTREQKVRTLLEHEEIGDRKPSTFLRRLQNLAGDTVSNEFLRTLWLGRLPRNIQSVLVSQKKESLSELASLADAVAEVTPGPQVTAASTAPDGIHAELAELRREIAALRVSRDDYRHSRPPSRDARRSPSRSRDARRSPSRSRDYNASPPPEDGRCWYHWMFGTAARRCRQPCNHVAENNRADR